MRSKIKHVILCGAGKGGTGKSTVCCLLALSLKQKGYTVGIFDADVSGPSIPKMMHVDSKLDAEFKNGIIPAITVDGIKVVSIELLMNDKTTAILWNGEKKFKYLLDALNEIYWGASELDYLIIDLPPNSGDEPQSVIKFVKDNKLSSGFLFVSTPQEVSMNDVLKSVNMALIYGIPIIGIVENMNGFYCSDCKKQYDIFGVSTVEPICIAYSLPYLMSIPIISDISIKSDIILSISNIPELIKPPIETLLSKVTTFFR